MRSIFAAIIERPLLTAALLFALSLVGSSFLEEASPWPWAALCGTLALASARLRGRAPLVAALAALLAFGAAGPLSALLRGATRGAPDLSSGPVERLVEGTVAEQPRTDAFRTRTLFAVERVQEAEGWREARFGVRLSAPPSAGMTRGDRLRARLRIEAPVPPQNPGAPDLRSRYRAEGLIGHARVVDGQLAAIGPRSGLWSWTERFRARFRERSAKVIQGEQARALVDALAIGERAQLSEEVTEEFAASGLVHILSVSGLHVAVVAAGLFRLLLALLRRSTRLLRRFELRSAAALLSLPPMALYILLTGAEVPAIRSGLMAGVVLLAMVVKREAESLTTLGVALLAVLAFDPAALHALSFQLSFAAMAGLLLLSRPLRALIPFKAPSKEERGARARLRWCVDWLLSTLAASLAASLATWPIVAEAFHRLSLAGLLSNLVALPVASLLTICCAAAALLFPLAPLSHLLLMASGPLASLLLAINAFFAHLPMASLLVGSLSPLSLAAWLVLLFALAGRRPWRRWRKRLALASALLLAITFVHRTLAPRLNRELAVTFFSVGQGDAALVELPGGRRLLIDACGDPSGRFDAGERILLPALAELGATRLDALALSHPDADHVAGAPALLEKLDVRELWVAPNAERAPELSPILALARDKGVKLRALGAGSVPNERWGPARVEILGPPTTSEPLSDNDASQVIRISLGEISFLFAGDLERRGEALLLVKGGVASTVLKAPHHGSDSSSTPEFVAAVGAREVLFSAGRDNRFRFPKESVVDRYRATGARIWRTDLDGAVRFVTDGKALRVEPFVEATSGRPSPVMAGGRAD